jgi:crotonobetainyl-CoA:carnitine CoA-transferase CaiB-like acyl-CoA transferase
VKTETSLPDGADGLTSADIGDFELQNPLADLLTEVGLSQADTGGTVTFAGRDPIVPAVHRLGACIGVPLMAGAVAAVAFHRHRGGPSQDLHLDLRQAVHTINPGAFWHPTLNGEPAPHALILDNPFLAAPYRTADQRWVMATAVYPHLAAKWCRFLDVPPDATRVAEVIATWDAFELEEAANAKGLPICVVRTTDEWLAHEQGALLASQPVIGLERIGDAPPRDYGESQRPFDGVRVLSFTHAVAGPAVGRTLAEQGADVLGATRPNDYEHEYIYAEANVGSRSAYLDLDIGPGKERAMELLPGADVVVNNHRLGALERRGLDPRELADRYPGIVYVSATCYGATGPWAGRGGFDMNGSATSGLMTAEGSEEQPRFPVTFLINDYITGYLGAVGATAALLKRATEGGSWHVTVNLTRTAMWCGSLGLVDPSLAGCDDAHSLRDPIAYDAPSPLGDVHMLAPPVSFSHTPPVWADPILVPRGSSRPEWRS